MKNPKLVEAVEVMRRASDSAYRSACDSAKSAYDSACDSARSASRSAYDSAWSAYWSAELDKKAVLKIIKGKYEQSKIS